MPCTYLVGNTERQVHVRRGVTRSTSVICAGMAPRACDARTLHDSVKWITLHLKRLDETALLPERERFLVHNSSVLLCVCVVESRFLPSRIKSSEK